MATNPNGSFIFPGPQDPNDVQIAGPFEVGSVVNIIWNTSWEEIDWSICKRGNSSWGYELQITGGGYVSYPWHVGFAPDAGVMDFDLDYGGTFYFIIGKSESSPYQTFASQYINITNSTSSSSATLPSTSSTVLSSTYSATSSALPVESVSSSSFQTTSTSTTQLRIQNPSMSPAPPSSSSTTSLPLASSSSLPTTSIAAAPSSPVSTDQPAKGIKTQAKMEIGIGVGVLFIIIAAAFGILRRWKASAAKTAFRNDMESPNMPQLWEVSGKSQLDSKMIEVMPTPQLDSKPLQEIPRPANHIHEM